MNSNRHTLETVAIGLGDMLPQFVFVGGTVVELYALSSIQIDVRFTDDVDCVVEVASLARYYDLEEKLRSIGFYDDMDEDAPICRKLYRGIKVDIMPTDESILKFSNRWYKEGFLYAQDYKLSDEITIKILPVAYFIASKLEAFFSPYRQYSLDMYASHDFEDIIYIMDNCPEVVASIKESNTSIKTYISDKFKHLRQQQSLVYALNGILRDDENEKRVLDIIEAII
jgi:Nucleotidyl transferase AbiEii toxin, Type IV TA system